LFLSFVVLLGTGGANTMMLLWEEYAKAYYAQTGIKMRIKAETFALRPEADGWPSWSASRMSSGDFKLLCGRFADVSSLFCSCQVCFDAEILINTRKSEPVASVHFVDVQSLVHDVSLCIQDRCG
jgi:hypothetical protein